VTEFLDSLGETRFHLGPITLTARQLCVLGYVLLVAAGKTVGTVHALLVYPRTARRAGKSQRHIRMTMWEFCWRYSAMLVAYATWVTGSIFLYTRHVTGVGPFITFHAIVIVVGIYAWLPRSISPAYRRKLEKCLTQVFTLDVYGTMHSYTLGTELSLYFAGMVLIILFSVWSTRSQARFEREKERRFGGHTDAWFDALDRGEDLDYRELVHAPLLTVAKPLAGLIFCVLLLGPSIFHTIANWTSASAEAVPQNLVLWVWYVPMLLPVLVLCGWIGGRQEREPQRA
jgi:hypothetical protein